MATIISQFKACRPTPWAGRYARIPGDNSVFHLRSVGGRLWPTMQWQTEEGIGTCAALPCSAAEQMAQAVEKAKHHAGGGGGGAFVINEFGQVLVPASDGGGRRFLAGQLEGRLLFENPFEPDTPIDLGDTSKSRSGDPWKLPYVGFPYNLNGRSQIYFYRIGEDGGQSVYPQQQDTTLIQSLRRIRRTGPVRFLVNPAGVVLTKRPEGEHWTPEESWEPVYVGRIDPSRWFEKE